MKTNDQLVDEVRASAFARQTAETLENTGINLDTVNKVRGKGKDFECSLLEIASSIGLENNKYPSANVQKIIKSSQEKFIRNYIFMTIYDVAKKVGFQSDEAVDFAAQSYYLSRSKGETDIEILRGWTDA